MNSEPHRISKYRRSAGVLLVVGGCFAWVTIFGWPMIAGTRSPTRTSIATIPQTVLWAWERPEDFRSLKTDDVAVAFLAQTVRLDAVSVTILQRHQPLELSEQTPLIAVVRIETNHHPLALASEELDHLNASIADLGRLPRVRVVQIDFDATVSERPFYRALLKETRRQLDHGIALSMTALMSWCMEDDWISDLPVDEIVPMAFRMGVGDRRAWQDVAASGGFRVAGCRTSIGMSTDEPIRRPSALPGRRVYMFHPRSWTDSTIATALSEVTEWR